MAIQIFRKGSKSRKSSKRTRLGAFRTTADSMKFAREGLLAWSRIIEDRELAKLSQLDDGSIPEAGLDDSAPWWCMVLSTEPVFLKPKERSECEMLMGLCPQGSSGVDWRKVARRAPEIFESWALEAASLTRLHLCPFDIDEDEPIDGAGPRHMRLGGRCYAAMPGFADPNFFHSLSPDRDAFDRRRALRRARLPVPASWGELYGKSYARDLWLAGFAPPADQSSSFDEWAAGVHAIAAAMLESGASRVERVPGFFARLPFAMDGENLACIDAARSDPLRERWDIQRSAGPAAAKRRFASL